MVKRILEVLVLFLLFISPLIHSSLEDSFQNRTTWSWLLIISIGIIAFFLMYPFRVQKVSRPLAILIGVIGISSCLLAIYPANSFAIYFVALTSLLCIAIKSILYKNRNNKRIFVIILLGFSSLYAQWGIGQFIVQHDVGIKSIGESVLTKNIPGIASFYIGSEKYIRAYGPFGHSNILGGVLLLGIIIVYRHKNIITSRLFFQGILFTISLGILVSFSRTALIGLSCIGIFFLYKKGWKFLVPVVLAASLFAPLLFHRSTDTHGAAIYERFIGLQSFIGMMNIQTSLRGFGLGNYTGALTHYLEKNSITHNPWDIAPIHSVPLFLTAELGLIIFIPFFILSIRFIYTHNLWIFGVLLPALLFDHYFATELSAITFLITSVLVVVQ